MANVMITRFMLHLNRKIPEMQMNYLDDDDDVIMMTMIVTTTRQL